MKKNLWALITLESYKKLVDMCEALDKTVDAIIKQAYDGRKDAYLIMQKIQDINYRKAGLINLKIVFEQTLKKLKDKEKILLFNIFCKGKKIEEYAVENEFCVRTLRRRYNSAVKHFADLLKAGGFNDSWFEENYNNEPYITLIGERVKDRQVHIQNMCKCEKGVDNTLNKNDGESEEKLREENNIKDNDCLVNDSKGKTGNIEDINLGKDDKRKLITILQEAVIKVNNKVAN